MIIFPHLCNLQKLCLAEHRTCKLHSDRHFVRSFCFSGRNIYRRNTGKINKRRIHIAQIHFKRIINFLPKLERRSRTRRTQNHIIRLEQFCHFALNSCAYGHSFFICIAGKLLRKNVVSYNNAPLYFRSETFRARIYIQFIVTFFIVNAAAVAYSVKAAQI